MRISWRQEEQWEKGTKWRADWLGQESPFGIISEIFAYLWRKQTFGFIKKDPHEETTQRQLQKNIYAINRQCIITANPPFNIHLHMSKETDSGVESFCKIITYCRQTSVNFFFDYWLCLAKLQGYLILKANGPPALLPPISPTLDDFFSRSDGEVVVLQQLWGNVLEVIIQIEKTNRKTKTKTDKYFFLWNSRNLSKQLLCDSGSLSPGAGEGGQFALSIS